MDEELWMGDHVVLCTFPYERAMVYESIDEERDRQEAKWGPQEHPNGTTEEWTWIADAYRAACQEASDAGIVTWHDIFLEEVFEAMSETDDENVEHELIQAIAVAVDWIEDIRRRRGK